MSRGSLYRSVQGLKTRRTSSNCWISFFKVSLSLFMWINIVHFRLLHFHKQKHFRPENPEFQEAFESVYEVRLTISLLKLGVPYNIYELKISGLHIVCKGKPSILELSASLARFWIQVLIWPECWMCLTFVLSLKTSLFYDQSNFRTMKQPSPQRFFNIFRL